MMEAVSDFNATEVLSRLRGEILIVDDEDGIRRTLSGALEDEGYKVHSLSDAEAAISLLEKQRIDLLLLDIWLPGMDGIEALRRIKARYPALPVIMISGHATIESAVQSTKLGASDFIEKPLDLNLTLDAIDRALKNERTVFINDQADESGNELIDLGLGRKAQRGELLTSVFHRQALAGDVNRQRTLKRSALLYGQGLHTGKKSGLILEPLPVNSGIHFTQVSHPDTVPGHVAFVQSTGLATTVRRGKAYAGTIEHLLSALHAYKISNLMIKCNGEVPIMDGSSLPFCALFEEIGIEEQSEDIAEIAVDRVIQVGNEKEFLRIEPADEFSVHYTLEYPLPLGKQEIGFTLRDIESYKREIAPARTFGFVSDIEKMQRKGLALGGRFDNFVLFGPEGAINSTLRFKDEPVRHKVLDLIGDIYLLGRPIRGKVTACRTGHSDNIALLSEIAKLIQN